MSDKYCIYLRKSRKDDDLHSETIEETLKRHRKTLLELAECQKLNVTKIYSEIVSGETINDRPEMQKLLRDVEQGKWRGVLVMEVERLARGDTTDQGRVAKAFKYSETLIITPNKIYDPTNEFDEEYFEFGLFMSRRELKTITRRLQEGRKRSVLEGKYVGNIAPYGYKRVKLKNEKGYSLKVLPEEANIVKMIFEWYTIGEKQADGTHKRLGVSLIAKRLNELKILPRKKGTWTASSVRNILKNPVYIGKVRWFWRKTQKKLINGELIVKRQNSEKHIITDGLHKGIIDKKTFELAKKIMKKNTTRPIRERNTIQNPLAGLIKCGICGRNMIRRPYNNYPDTLICPTTSCKNVSSSLHLVEEKIIEGIKNWISDYKLQWQIKNTSKQSTNITFNVTRKSLAKLNKEIKTLHLQQSNLDDLLEQKIYDVEKYKKRTNILNKKLKKAEENYKKLQIIIKGYEKEKKRKIIVPQVEKIIETYYALPTPQAKNDLLKDVLEKVIYTKNQSGRWHTSPDDFELILYPRLPCSTRKYQNSQNKH